MRITKVTVKNFRSIEQVEINPAEFNVIVGQNNHGKTNFFAALDWFFNAKKSQEVDFFKKDTRKEILVELEYSGAQKAAASIPTDANKTKIIKLLDGADTFSIRKTNVDHKRTYVVGGKESPNPSGIDTAVNEYLPRLEYVTTQLKPEDFAKYGSKNPIGIMLSGVLTQIVSKSSEYAKFEKEFEKVFGESHKSKVRTEINKLSKEVEVYLEKQFPDGAKVTFQVLPPQLEELLKNFSSEIDDGIITDAVDKGDGMQRALMLAIIQAYADHRKRNNLAQDFLFLIDEAELHLHPAAQRALKEALLDISARGDQVMINTHSSVFVADDRTGQSIFRAEKAKGITGIDPVSSTERPDVVFDLLGGSPTDLLLPSNILIVEGYSEVSFIREIIQKYYPTKYSRIQVVPANGDISKTKKSMKLVNSAYECFKSEQTPYSDKVIILVDKPSASKQRDYDDFSAAHPEVTSSGRYFELPVESLEEYYPAPHTEHPDTVENKGGKNVYAKTAGKSISQSDFETKMSVMHQALEKACELGFGS